MARVFLMIHIHTPRDERGEEQGWRLYFCGEQKVGLRVGTPVRMGQSTGSAWQLSVIWSLIGIKTNCPLINRRGKRDVNCRLLAVSRKKSCEGEGEGEGEGD